MIDLIIISNALIKLAGPYGFRLEDADLIIIHGGSIKAIFTDSDDINMSIRAKELIQKEEACLSKKFNR